METIAGPWAAPTAFPWLPTENNRLFLVPAGVTQEVEIPDVDINT